MKLLPLIIIISLSLFVAKLSQVFGGFEKMSYSIAESLSNLYSAYANEGGGEHGGGGGEHGGGEKKEEKPKPKPETTDPKRYKVHLKPSETMVQIEQYNKCTPADYEILTKLKERRKELDDREKALSDKENILSISDKNIVAKIDELKVLKDEVKALLEEYNKQEDDKINSLVKIYSNMKPKDAANIFEELDMPTLLKVINKMKEAKAASIIGQMTPSKAKDLTFEIANQKKITNLPCLCDQ